MAPRFPIDEAPSSATKQTMQDALVKMHGGPPPFKWIEDDGRSLVGCYAPLSYTPLVTQPLFETAKACYRPETVKPRNRELAILALASIMKAPYLIYCHRALAAKVGLSPEQFEDGLAGKVPQGLSEEESMAYRLGLVFTNLTGPLDEATWQEATSKMEKLEFVGILHVVAGYRWVALCELANGLDERWN